MKLLVQSLEGVNGYVAIATHSTTIVSSLGALSNDVRVGFLSFGQQNLNFKEVDKSMRMVLPMFGAHPLSNVFNEKPLLIVEGEDDERIWQTAVRSSQGRIALYPGVAGSIQNISEHEEAARLLIESVYDDAKTFSLRDRDDDPYEIDNLGPIVRMRLACRNAENLIVTDDVLNEFGTDWASLRPELERWAETYPEHSRHVDAIAFCESGWDRKNFQLKNLRMLLVGISGSKKPWEVAVGQAIAKLPDARFDGENCLQQYLGQKVTQELGLLN